MKLKHNFPLLCVCAFMLTLVGCVATVPETDIQPETPSESRVVHKVVSSPPSICGPLDEFLIDAQKLDGAQSAALLQQLSGYDVNEFSCDRLKTGLLMSQISKTADEDALAIKILGDYEQIDKLTDSERRLIKLMIQHSEDLKRLHVLLKKLGDKLIAEKALSETMSADLLTLQQKLNQLQKIEADINETEQSISAPTSSSLNTDGS